MQGQHIHLGDIDSHLEYKPWRDAQGTTLPPTVASQLSEMASSMCENDVVLHAFQVPLVGKPLGIEHSPLLHCLEGLHGTGKRKAVLRTKQFSSW